MKNSEYWKLRFVQLEEAQNKLANEGCKEIEGIYRQTLKEIEGKIDTWYRRLAKNNEISMAEARKFLSGSELEEFKWDVHDYIKYGKENAVSGQWVKQLENASAKFHISKYEALKIQTQQSFESLFAKQEGITSGTMAEVYKSGYYHTAFEIQKGVGVGWDISGIDQNKVEKVLSKPWAVDGKNFSERIWSNKEKLISEVHNELTRNIITGADPQTAIDSIAKKMNTSKYNAGRLVMTESAYFNSSAQKDCFNDLGVEKFEVVATLDSITSEICQNMDGKVFDMKDYQPGVTANPFHPNCRSTTCPYFDEDFGEVGERAARGEDGKTYYVPADMNYKKWKEEFVDGGNKSGFVSREEREEQERKDKGRKMVDDFWKETSGNVGREKNVDKSGESGIISVEKNHNDSKGDDNILKLTSKFVNPNEKLFRYADKIAPIEGYGDIVCHGSIDGFIVNGLDGEVWTYTAKEAAEIIRNSKEYKGQNIRLIVCQAGAGGENSIAQQISDELGVEIMASDEIINVDSEGNIFLSDNGVLAWLWHNGEKVVQTGKWIIFKPRK